MPVETIGRPFVGLSRRESFPQRLAARLYRRLGRGGPGTGASTEAINIVTRAGAGTTPVTVVCISDTHNTKPSPLPPGDILLHAGDLSQYGTWPEIQAQLTWLADQPHPHKIVIAGNHDLLLDRAFVAAHPDRELERRPEHRRDHLDWGALAYLERESVDLTVGEDGRRIRVFGSPWTPRCGNWAFQYAADAAPSGDSSSFSWEGAVPDGTDVVLAHGPPAGHLDDGGKGCARLLAELWRVRPRLVVCGHIHAGRGREWLPFDAAQAWYENVTLGRRQWLSLAGLMLCVLWDLITGVTGRRRAGGGGLRGTCLVNAAVVGGRGNTEPRDPVVLVI
ncbi:hypothetical protein VTK73DRAFT_3614 [Phialemonium thermophilum]|uniref:Calcineurin-like phosphoesterase domain-containing protein n=1 Tax=Phialemonium thermophilum TaxID=223376 RepID=A0ABR3WYH7_9PEZI